MAIRLLLSGVCAAALATLGACTTIATTGVEAAGAAVVAVGELGATVAGGAIDVIDGDDDDAPANEGDAPEVAPAEGDAAPGRPVAGRVTSPR